MGCIFSRPRFESNPRIFDVWNVDGDGRQLKPGWIEVTESQLVLYQKRNIVVRWPLCGLRRYGFDSELFSFESGRRCPTGPGVYAFKCRRAQELFTVLQESINNCPIVPHGQLEDQASATDRLSPAGHLPYPAPVDSNGYLEPIPATPVSPHEYTLHYSRGTRNPQAGSPGSYVCIHSELANGGPPTDWPGVSSSSLSTCCSSLGHCPSNHTYVNNEVALLQNGTCPPQHHHHHHSYVNAEVVDMHRCCSLQRCAPDSVVTLSPGHLSRDCCGAPDCASCLDVNTNYAKLDDLLKQEQSAKRIQEKQHCYMNVEPECVVQSGDVSSPTDDRTSRSPKDAREFRCYENLAPGDGEESVGVTYALLDLEPGSKQCEGYTCPTTLPSPASCSTSVHSPVSSPAKTPESYAQIDFDKTVALSNSVNPSPFNDDSMRKTRHNASGPCRSLSS